MGSLVLTAGTRTSCARVSSSLKRTILHPQPHLTRHASTHSSGRTAPRRPDEPLRMAIVGSGPAGFYTAYRVMSRLPQARVDMYESLPVPYGLVRFGVAPDHPEVKNCQDKFEEIASSPNFTFVGNVSVGDATHQPHSRTVQLPSLLRNYDAILFSYGAIKDKALNIPGESSLAGIYSARQFVGWYNGLPESAALAPNLTTGDEAVVIGQGNVALDVARILLEDIDVLRKTDITDEALATLATSRIRRVHVVGRRGPMQAQVSTAPRSWSLDFCLSPTEFVASDVSPHFVGSTVLERTELTSKFDPNAQAQLKGEKVILPSSLVFRSIGYKSAPLLGFQEAGVLFDERRGVIMNDGQGRVLRRTSTELETDIMSEISPGLYCAGWVKRGPTGVIATTMQDAFDTGDSIVRDWLSGIKFLQAGEDSSSSPLPGWDRVRTEMAVDKNQPTVDWHGWRKIDQAEREKGQEKGKEREKFTSTKAMLEVVA
ncbi:NADPH:adrenodoxin oxidoreductase [Verticillium dahliae VdLs.17]|uniref:NADPH:adrenodoxin oxidoreductase, mitochondrial n=1 Tax=Verticillium dahliae (strain VdLs.17 / ATCC MYA-4575 / FGSC 10137) TaxID=498257 RepID=G2XG64_VERDV|nr:NADPH:adrenodoxin oxidoreductase [Verticillium dahliae VdLs.17]EGY18883.1 NADPH:adrenodoxin oxidoreductase [Verticillium dahliae VdLs.17]